MAIRANALVGIFCGLLAGLIWGGGAVVSRYLVLGHLAPADLVFFRYLGCFPIAVAALMVFGRRARLDISAWRFATLFVLAGPAYQFVSISGYEFVGAGQGSLLLLGMLPAFALLIGVAASWRIPSLRAIIGVALAIGGLIVFGDVFHHTETISMAGVGLFAIASFGWAATSYLVRRWRVDPIGLVVSLALWSPLCLPLYFVVGPAPNVSAVPVGDALLQLFYHGWIAAFGATALFFMSVRKVGAESAAILQVLAPCMAAALGALLLAEPLSGPQLAGAALTIIGIIVAARAGSIRSTVEIPVPVSHGDKGLSEQVPVIPAEIRSPLFETGVATRSLGAATAMQSLAATQPNALHGNALRGPVHADP